MWWFLASLAWGADVAEEADHLFQLGVRDYAAGAYEDALGHLLASYRLAPNRNVQFNIARVYEQLGKKDLAWRHYHDYVEATADPTARADGEAALARLDPDVARVRITSLPTGATVYVGRVDLGARGLTPLTLALPPGKRSILLDLDGYVRAETTADLAIGKESRTAVELLPQPAAARPATTSPFQAVVRAGPEVLIEADATHCSLLPGVVKGAGAARSTTDPLPAAGPGSALAAVSAVPPLALDVTRSGLTTRAALERVDRVGMALREAGALHTWVFDRCVPTEGKEGTSLAKALEGLPPPVRAEAIAVFAEWAAVRGATDVAKAASMCTQGQCAGLVGALVTR